MRYGFVGRRARKFVFHGQALFHCPSHYDSVGIKSSNFRLHARENSIIVQSVLEVARINVNRERRSIFVCVPSADFRNFSSIATAVFTLSEPASL